HMHLLVESSVDVAAKLSEAWTSITSDSSIVWSRQLLTHDVEGLRRVAYYTARFAFCDFEDNSQLMRAFEQRTKGRRFAGVIGHWRHGLVLNNRSGSNRCVLPRVRHL